MSTLWTVGVTWEDIPMLALTKLKKEHSCMSRGRDVSTASYHLQGQQFQERLNRRESRAFCSDRLGSLKKQVPPDTSFQTLLIKRGHDLFHNNSVHLQGKTITILHCTLQRNLLSSRGLPQRKNTANYAFRCKFVLILHQSYLVIKPGNYPILWT